MLGCALYEISSLRKPFPGKSIHSVMTKILFQDAEKLPENYSEEL
jgi:hypothetical protein